VELGAGPRPRPEIPHREAEREQLERILASQFFARSERLSVFLRFIAERSLDGSGSSLKEQVLGSELYRKGLDFNGNADPVVRVTARRLRDKLREYYAEFPDDPIVISLPKGTYVPLFEQNRTIAPPVATHAIEIRHDTTRRWLPATAALAAVLAAVLTWFVWLQHPAEATRLIRLTPFPGQKGPPALSPDGRSVAFSFAGPDDVGEPGIWVKAVDGSELRRLTRTPNSAEISPAWSPDGREIAFVRPGEGVFIIPAIGGSERKVSPSGTDVDWAPDGKSILIRDGDNRSRFCIYQILLDSLERRQLTRPESGGGDANFRVSPDGSTVAFIRHGHPGAADLYVASIQGGEPRRLTNWNDAHVSGVVWTADGHELIYSNQRLWRIPADVKEPGHGTLLASITVPASYPSISRSTPGTPVRLAFQMDTHSDTFRIVDLTAPLHKGYFQVVKPFVAPTEFVYPGAFSSDGRKFLFISGPPPLGVWSYEMDHSARLITSIQATHITPGSWSPDERRIVFDAVVDGNDDVFGADVSSGKPERLTRDSSIDGIASWSRDGRWIYYSSTRSGTGADIWRLPAGGGPPKRITYHGGIRSLESADGKYLYYVDRPPDNSTGKHRLLRVPVEGGAEERVLSGISVFWWSVVKSGIFFITRESEFDAIDWYNFDDRKVVRVGRLVARIGPRGSLSVSPDGRWALVPSEIHQSDLRMVNDFK
jgi:Tol biopolymer transport system component